VTATPTTIHVGDLDGASNNLGKFWSATVAITVHTAQHSLVAGALVTGSWSGGASGSASCTTGAAGTCSVTSPSIRKNLQSVTWTVSGVSSGGLVYQPGSNHDPDGDSNGTSITVAK